MNVSKECIGFALDQCIRAHTHKHVHTRRHTHIHIHTNTHMHTWTHTLNFLTLNYTHA